MDQGPLDKIPPKTPPQPPPKSGPLSPENPAPLPEPISDHAFLGMSFSKSQWTLFLNQISKMFIDQIKHNTDRMLKAIKNFGKDSDDDN